MTIAEFSAGVGISIVGYLIGRCLDHNTKLETFDVGWFTGLITLCLVDAIGLLFT